MMWPQSWLTSSSTTFSATGHVQIWSTWVNSTGSTVLYQPWGAWNRDAGTTNTSCVQLQVWNGWQTISNTDYRFEVECQQVPYTPPPPETPEQAAARRVQQEKYRVEQLAREAKYAKEREERNKLYRLAETRASRLLRSCLSAAQLAELEKTNAFMVKTPDGRLWKIEHGTHNNVKLMDAEGKKAVASYCIQPADVPAGDAMLAQKLMLETNVREFERIANIHRM